MNYSNTFRFAPLASSFVMHLIWENAQMPFFESGDASLWDVFSMCLFATATGDMLFMLTLYLTVAVRATGITRNPTANNQGFRTAAFTIGSRTTSFAGRDTADQNDGA